MNNPSPAQTALEEWFNTIGIDMDSTEFEAIAKRIERETVRAVLDLLSIEGADFDHNKANDRGTITSTLFTGPGDPWVLYRGASEFGNFMQRDGTTVRRETGRYHLNDAAVDMVQRLMAERRNHTTTTTTESPTE